MDLNNTVGTAAFCEAVEADLSLCPDGAEHLNFAQHYFASIEWLGDNRVEFKPAFTLPDSALHLAAFPVVVTVLSDSTLLVESAGHKIPVKIDLDVKKLPSLELKRSLTGRYRFGIKILNGSSALESAMHVIESQSEAQSILYQAISQTVRGCWLALA